MKFELQFFNKNYKKMKKKIKNFAKLKKLIFCFILIFPL